MTAVGAIRQELRRVQKCKGECVYKGQVLTASRYKYGMLLKQETYLTKTLQWLEDVTV